MASLANPFFKKLGIIITILGVIVLIALYALGLNSKEPGAFERIIIQLHYVIILGLVMLSFSKEDKDDEGIRQIRYSALKFCFRLILIFIPFYILIANLDKVEFAPYPILYMIEGILILYQILFRIGIKYNPDWMFKEPTKGKTGFYVLFIILVFFLVLVIFDIIWYLT